MPSYLGAGRTYGGIIMNTNPIVEEVRKRR